MAIRPSAMTVMFETVGGPIEIRVPIDNIKVSNQLFAALAVSLSKVAPKEREQLVSDFGSRLSKLSDGI